MLDLAQHLFGVEIRPWATEVWAPDVSAYEMVRNGAVIGRFYFDMHPREGKYTHAAMAPLRIGITGLELPVAVLMKNFPKGLMEHGDVVTFLHEFGHLMAWLFTGVEGFVHQHPVEMVNKLIQTPE